MPESTLQAIIDKLIPFVVAAILTIIGALIAVYKWVFKRQLKRLDDVIDFAEDLDKTQVLLDMQLTVVQQNADDQKTIHKESMEAIHAKIAADDLRHEKRMDRLDDYFRQYLELSSRRRADD